MEATLGTLEHYSHQDSRRISDLTRSVGSWFTGVFGCAHKQMSRPFSRHGESYRVCIGCGAHRKFDPETWKPMGRFYFKSANTSDLLETNSSALKCV